jgi:hypothetical protein
MIPNNKKSKRAIKSIRQCKFGCQKWIAWNAHSSQFIEAETGEKHICPNLKLKGHEQRNRDNNMNNILTTKELLDYINTIGASMTQVLCLHGEILDMHKEIPKIFEQVAEILKKLKKKCDWQDL